MNNKAILVIAALGAAWYLSKNPQILGGDAPSVPAPMASEDLLGSQAALQDFTGSISQLETLEGLVGRSDPYKEAIDNAYAAVQVDLRPGETVAWSRERGYYAIPESDAAAWFMKEFG